MTKMLVSVRNREEAQTALKSGADIVDLASGKAGGLPVDTVTEVAKLAADGGGVSAACYDPDMEPHTILHEAEKIAAAGADYIRIGLFPSERLPGCVTALSKLAGTAKLIGVLYAGQDYPDELPASLARAGFHGIMLDTAETGERLLDRSSLDLIGAIIATAHEHSLIAGVAGGLEAPDIPRLLVHRPDFLGFHGLDADELTTIRALIPEMEIRAMEPHFSKPEQGDLGTYKIFVRDFALPVHIGAYSFEHGKPQQVRFDVTAEVRRVVRIPVEMRHVVSYDLIMDGIRSIVARGHVELSETLAEEIASLVLAHPRVIHVVVRVEKLELGPGGVGVEIERSRRV
ncbi:hypothetical protein GCM10011491_06540 [Brucella endophytica]|uniref:(5-formylfuran-3-yl)methyl phosphate synthase n=1 Tax=Brucella endophytica TaxID=1963359 RepID=A0A916WB47_9HYPH|nr:(5-formylfuran-3-yl)methyl phosphate synthase [Brucella endophytica]GGA81870.1 hypothetical protein GCM10011491_06540 [Brucella endophytica]